MGRGSPAKRRWPSLQETWRFVGPALRSRRKKWDHVLTTEDFRKVARRRAPRAVFDYVDGAAESELSMTRAVAAFRGVTFHPHVLRDVSTVDTSTAIMGRPAALPVVLAPTGFTRMMHTEGEPAVARAAALAGIPYALSTLGTTAIARLRAAAPAAELWFQLYVSKDHSRSEELLEQAAGAGYTTLVLTVDVPVAGARHRDTYSGLTLPPTLSPTTLASMAFKPRWVLDLLTTEPLRFEALGTGSDLATIFRSAFDPSVTLADLEWLRGRWKGSIVVKGVQRTDDAKALADAGVDAIAVSNHGGRQLDRAATPLQLLPKVLDSVGGRIPVFLDGGVRSGADVAAAVALGAQAAFIGRPYLYALMAGGQDAVEHLLDVIAADYRRTLQLLGVRDTASLSRDLVSLSC